MHEALNALNLIAIKQTYSSLFVAKLNLNFETMKYGS